MRHLSPEDKLAALLKSLAPQAAESLLGQLDPSLRGRVRDQMQRLGAAPPSTEFVEEVIAEVERWLAADLRDPVGGGDHAPRRPTAKPARAESGNSSQGPGPASSRPSAPAASAEAGGVVADDPIAQLRSLEADQLAGSLTGEHPRAMSIVLSCLDPEKAAEVLKRLPSENRQAAFVLLGSVVGGNAELVVSVARAVLLKTQKQSESPIESSDEAKYERLAGLLRLMQPAERVEMLRALEDHDADTAAVVKDRLYVFEDLLVIEDQSIQKLLMEIDMRTLSLALKNAPANIQDKVTRNLSKRARDLLHEEMDLLGTVPPAKTQEAQKAVVEAMQRLDQKGELIMVQ
ncbi:MAG: hypothetical protein HY000_05055 [Planctomycetes bacterium]|nr:hypothetical protein [Planctomycetota bacterium]